MSNHSYRLKKSKHMMLLPFSFSFTIQPKQTTKQKLDKTWSEMELILLLFLFPLLEV